MNNKAKQQLFDFFEQLLPDFTKAELEQIVEQEEKILEEDVDMVEILAKVKNGQ